MWFIPLGIYAAVFLIAIGLSDYNLVGGLVVAPLLALVAWIGVSQLLRREPDPVIRRIVIGGLVLKFAASLGNYAMVYWLYDGVGDAVMYHRTGAEIASQIRTGDFSVLGQPSQLMGTQFIRVLTGGIFLLIGPTALGGFLVFAMFAFAGSYFFFRAFSHLWPDGNRRLYGAVIFLLPSMLFWPASIGKESWLLMGLGITAYGVSRIARPGRWAIGSLLVGLATVSLVRPHLTLMLVAGITVAVVLSMWTRSSNRGLLRHRYGPFVLLVAGAFAAGRQAQALFRLDAFTFESIVGFAIEVERRTGGVGTTFAAPNVFENPLLLPIAIVTVLARPLPFEAHNIQAMVAALEGMLVLGLLAWRARYVAAGVMRSVRDFYLAVVVTYSLAFVVAFSTFGNFGLLARQRTSLLPFALVLACVPFEKARVSGVTRGARFGPAANRRVVPRKHQNRCRRR